MLLDWEVADSLLHEWIQLSTLWTVEYCRPLNQLSISDATSVHGGGVLSAGP